MKKLISLFLTFTIAAGIAIPVFAAAPEKYADCTTNTEKIEWLKSQYSITDLWEWLEDVVGTEGKKTEALALDRLEYGWQLVGTSTTKQIFNYFLERMPRGPKFQVDYSDLYSPFAPSLNGAFNGSKSSINFAIKADYQTSYVAPVKSVVHETMHALDRGLLENGGSKAISTVNGSYAGYTNTAQYVTTYAATDAGEDFADTCTEMIVNGGDTPYTLSKDTILYKKYVACYELLLEHFGKNSNSVIRSAAFLGIELPKD